MRAACALSCLQALLRLPVPAAATPLAIATLAMLVVQSMDHQYVRTHQTLALVITGFLVLLFVALYRALAPTSLKLVTVGQRWLTVGLIVLMAGNTMLHVAMSYDHLSKTDRYTNDAVAVTDCATHLFLRGANPYKNVHMLTCLDSHGLDAFSTTPLQAPNGPFWRFRSYPSPMSGGLKWLWYRTYKRELYLEQHDPSYVAHDFESRFNYPGGAILIAIPVLVLGFRDLLPLYLGCTVLASILIYRRAERRIRWVVGLLLLGDTPLLLDGLGGLTDATYALFPAIS